MSWDPSLAVAPSDDVDAANLRESKLLPRLEASHHAVARHALVHGLAGVHLQATV
jgi:hypothetical protein